MDARNNLLNAVLIDEVLYVSPPLGYEGIIMKGKYLRLLKALYGLKKASRM